MFILDHPNGDEDTYIFIKLTCWDGTLKRTTKEKVHPDNWAAEAERPVVKKSDDKAKALLLKLNRLYDAIETLRTTCSITGEKFTKAAVSRTIDEQLQQKPTRRLTFKQAAEQIIEEMKSGAITTDRGKKYSVGTIKNYNQSLNALVAFSTARKVSIEFNQVTLGTYHSFIQYCNDQDWSLNYTGQHLKNWKCLMAEALQKGWHKNRIHEFDDFKTLSEETFDIFLDEKELGRMIKHNLSFNYEYDVARDWFIIGCYTALRVSDLKLLDETRLNNDTIILANEKTDERVVLPVHPHVRSILKKWKGFPPAMADQTINEKIKQVAQLCKITGKVLYSVTKGGKRKDFYMQKWEMVSLHTARRSFITNARKNGMPDSIVMKLAGIRKPATLQRYDKLSADEAAIEAAKHSFFRS
jgi:site-specific recombinase XerD